MRKGFTLIELLVVVLIIGILAAVALPQYRKAVYKAKAAEAFTYLDALRKAEGIYYLENGHYTDSISNLSVSLPEMKYHSVSLGWIDSMLVPYIYSHTRGYGSYSIETYLQDLPGSQPIRCFGPLSNSEICKTIMPCGSTSCYM